MADDGLTLEQRRAIALAEAELELEEEAKSKEASWGSVIGDAVTKAGAGLVDSIVNVPENVYALGQVAGGMMADAYMQDRPETFGTDYASSLPQPELPPNRVTEYLQDQGLVGSGNNYSPAQRVTDAAVQGATLGLVNPAAGGRQALTNMAVGGLSAGTGRAVADVTGSEAAGVASSILAPAGAGRTSAVARAQRMKRIENQIKDETRAAARELGFVTIPENNLGKFVNNPKLMDKMEATNQAVVNEIAKRTLGIPENVPLYEKSIERVRKDAYDQGYKPLEQLGTQRGDSDYFYELADIEDTFAGASTTFPDAVKKSVSDEVNKYMVSNYDTKDVVQAIRRLRADSTRNLRSQDNPEAYDLGLAQKAIANALEGLIERNLAKSTLPPFFMDQYRAARRRIAEAHTVEESLKRGTSNVQMDALASAFQRGEPIQGELGTAAAFANVFKPRDMAPKAPGREDYAFTYILPLTAGSYIANRAGYDPLMGAAIGTGIHAAGKVAGNTTRNALGNVALGDSYQNRVASPTYSEYGLGPLTRITPALATLGSGDGDMEE